MAKRLTGNVNNQLHFTEHSEASAAKRVLPLGFDDGGSQYLSLAVDSLGRLEVVGSGGMGGTEYTEDAVATGGESGPLVLGVRQDADTSPVDATGDYHGLVFDDSGNLKVNAKVLANGTVSVSNFPASQTVDGTVAVSSVGGVVSVSGTVAVSNTTFPTGAELNEDDAHSSGQPGYMLLGVTQVTQASLIDSDGDLTPMQFDGLGGLRTDIGRVVRQEDSLHSSGDRGIPMWAVRRDVNGALSDNNDYTPLHVDVNGHLKIAVKGNLFSVNRAISETGHDLQAASFSGTTALADTYVLDSINLKFSSSEERSITVTNNTTGVILWKKLVSTANSVVIRNFDHGFSSSDEVKVDVTQTSGACTMDCHLHTRSANS